jgi:AbiV family abortive infection protein
MPDLMSVFPIPWQETLEGCRLSIENAERLAQDSQVLRADGRLQTAYSVSLDAWEEMGKAILLYRYYKTKEPVSQNDWYKILHDHKHKRVAWINSMDLLYGTTPPKSITQLKPDLEKAIQEGDLKNWFNLEREVGVHVDWIGGKDRWRSSFQH